MKESTWDRSGAPTWVITAHALERYCQRVRRGISYQDAAKELERHLSGAHFVKLLRGGLEQWRGPKPERIRIRVMRIGERLKVTTIMTAFDGLARWGHDAH